ncbi:MAG: exodeoxyribonuclease VII large subunit [bacterium]
MQPENRLTVGQFNHVLNSYLGSLGEFIVEGEITQLNISTKGGVNIVLKDLKEQAVVNLSGFRPRIQGLNFVQEGMQVACWGTPQIWSPSGRLSLNIFKILPLGEGALKAAYDQLKAQLSEEGLFNEERKRPLPEIITKIALITAKDSAAYGDFVKILQENHANIAVDFYPVQVQGKYSQLEIKSILQLLTEMSGYDCIVLIRGGGSLEDLITFNDEIIAREIFAAKIPVVVGVGHERDESIADFVADIRASTPSQAAYYLVAQNNSYLETLVLQGNNFYQQLIKKIQFQQLELLKKESLIHNFFMIITSSLTAKLELLKIKAKQIFVKNNIIRTKIETLTKLIEANNPQKILQRGYALLQKNGHYINSIKQVKINEQIDIQVKDGKINSQIIKLISQK